MSPQALARQRLANQHLVDPGFTDAVEVVAALGAVQAQDYAGAKWAVAQRTRSLDDAAVEQAFIDGAIVRTHVLRPTWHFVAAEDLRWMLSLTAERVHAANAYQYRQFCVDAELIRRSHRVLERVLCGGEALTRTEIVAAWEAAGIATGDAVRVACLLMWAELDALICSGPRRGKQFTYCLVDERLPPTKPLQHDEALAELARRYFTTRGPATLHDFSWWSGLTVSDAKKAVALLGAALSTATLAGAAHWFAEPARAAATRTGHAHLLPNYDEYFVGFRNRSAALQRIRAHGAELPDALYSHVVVIDGQLAGGWKREIGAQAASLQLTAVTPLSAPERRAVDAAAQRYARFLGLPVALSVR